MYQAFGGRLIQVITIEEPSLGRPKCGRSRLKEVQFTILCYSYYGTLITGHFIGGPLIERRSRYVTLPWKQNFWMTTNRLSHLHVKVYSHYFKLHRSYSISFNLANLGEIFFGTVSIVISV